MNGRVLRTLEITNFRSIRGHIHVPLDAKVVLIHGENGAGKTSLLSAIELGLTGSVQALRRTDPDYACQLLHRSTSEGSVTVETASAGASQRFTTMVEPTGIASGEALDPGLASFFSERAYLPQSLLGQLLQIYQEADSGIDSPLARFVSDLLGLDRLDALEAGLRPLADVRNVRKVVNGWSHAEIEKERLQKLLDDQRRTRMILMESLTRSLAELKNTCHTLGLSVEVREDSLNDVGAALGGSEDEEAFGRLTDRRRRLGSIRRELERADSDKAPQDITSLASSREAAAEAYRVWEAANGERLANMRMRVEALLPHVSLPSDLARFAEAALTQLRSQNNQLADGASQARADLERLAKARDELDIARRQLSTIDSEIAQISSSAGSLGSVLAELSSFIVNDLCPVCERDFGELGAGSLGEHVHAKVRALSGSAERLLALGRSRGDQQLVAERLEREIEALKARAFDTKALTELDRRAVEFDRAISELESAGQDLAEGANLSAADVKARRAFSDAQSRDGAIAAARETFTEFALAVGEPVLADDETLDAALRRLEKTFETKGTRLTERLALRRQGRDIVSSLRSSILRRNDIDKTVAGYEAQRRQTDLSLERGRELRENGQRIQRAVDEVRSEIIRREFNDRLNRVWRDLFVRLAPGEPFVPAFRIPPSGTQRLQPKLITEHRDGGDAGGTPGAMLSAGNLNTAALTLFIALHLSMPTPLPWLILDDPVQSMDDVHIAHFAALLRTLAKEHKRQVIIAVHDRQLFEYLKLELSPAYPDDSLLTLELSRHARRDTLCISERLRFQEETALLAVA